MKLRDLRRQSGEASVPVWPPQGWASSYRAGDHFAVGEQGELRSVTRQGDRLTLTMFFEDREHVAVLEWDAPPTVAAVEAALRARIGQPLKGMGEIDV